MNLYQAIYKNKKIEVLADTSYKAQTKAAKELKAKNAYDVTIMLIALNSEQYIHSTASI